MARGTANPTANPSANAAGEAPDAADRGVHPRWEPTEFELRLTLGSTVLVAMTWIVLLAAAYVLGVSNGREQQLLSSDQAARARGAQIEEGSQPTGASDSGIATALASEGWFGVRLASYPAPTEKWKNLIAELKDTLAKRYGEDLGLRREEIEHWVFKDGTAAVYAGCFQSENDPKLIQLAANLRKIGDWPHGNDPSPFKSAETKKLPDTQLAKKLGLSRSKPGN